MDSNDIESRYSNEDYFDFMRSILSEEMTEDSKLLLEKIRDKMSFLPKMEMDFFSLYFFSHKSQTDIAAIFEVSQPTVCYRLKKAKERIKYVLGLPDITDDQIRERLSGVLKDEEDVEIMILMFRTTCQSEVAKRMHTSQGKVRHRFLRSISRMKAHEHLNDLTTCYENIEQNLTILKEVSRKSKNNLEYYID